MIAILSKPIKKAVSKFIDRYKVAGGIVLLSVLWAFEIIWTCVFCKVEKVHWIIYINPLFRMVDYVLGVVAGQMLVSLRETEPLKKRWLRGLFFLDLLLLAGAYFLSALAIDTPFEALFYCAAWTPISLLSITVFYLFEFEESTMLMCKNKWIAHLGDLSGELFLIHQMVIRYGKGIMAFLHYEPSYGVNIGLVFLYFALSYLGARIWLFLWKRIVPYNKKGV